MLTHSAFTLAAKFSPSILIALRNDLHTIIDRFPFPIKPLSFTHNGILTQGIENFKVAYELAIDEDYSPVLLTCLKEILKKYDLASLLEGKSNQEKKTFLADVLPSIFIGLELNFPLIFSWQNLTKEEKNNRSLVPILKQREPKFFQDVPRFAAIVRGRNIWAFNYYGQMRNKNSILSPAILMTLGAELLAFTVINSKK